MDRARRIFKTVKIKLAVLREHHAEAKRKSLEPIVPTLSVRSIDDEIHITTIWERVKNGERFFPRFVGAALAFMFLIAAAISGISVGGQYQTFTTQYGSGFDIVARGVGFSISEISISGNKEITNAEILSASGINSSHALTSLNVVDIQARLKRLALISDASVRKLYPNKLVITLVEREPYALWQKDGDVRVISSDGTVIEGFNDARFKRLPHIVGEGANLRVREYVELLDAAPQLKDKIRAGTLISERRWNLKLANGVDVKLPEEGAALAIAKLAKLDMDANVLEKDILAIDLRVSGRAAFRLTEASAQYRAEINAKKIIRKGKA
jgi:cell division protein FtsQ